MSSFVGKVALGGIEKEMKSTVNSTFGGFQNQFSGRSAQETRQIDWANFNYPPFFRIFHYDPQELPDDEARIVKIMHWSFMFALVALTLNFLDSLVLVVAGWRCEKLIYSLLNFIILSPYFCYTFYRGYKAMAITSAKYSMQYTVLQSCAIFVSLLFALIPLGSMNGLIRLGFFEKAGFEVTGGIKSYWIVAIIFESLIWLLCSFSGGFSLYKTKTHDPYKSQENAPRT